MLSQRLALRATRTARINAPAIRRNVRFATNDAGAGAGSGAGQSPALYGGLVGGGAAFVVCYMWYQLSGMKSAVQSAKQAKSYFDSTTDKLKVSFKEVTPDTNEAIEALRSTANKYARFVPGGQGYVDKVFQDIEAIRKNHGSEVDEIVSEAYGQLRDASKKGASLETMSDVWDILSKQLHRLAGLAGDAAQDILNNHPQLKNQLGGSYDQLKEFGENIGPEAQKQVNETFNEISNILQQGFQWDTVDRIRQLVQNKAQELQKLQKKAFDQGWDQIKPMLDKNPKVKEVVNKNMDTLKQGNVAQLLNQVRSAVSSGNTSDLENYVKQATQKAQQSTSSNLGSWLNMIPNGSQIMPQLQKLQKVAQEQGGEAEQLARDTMKEITQVLEKRGQKLEQLWQDGQKKAKESS